MKKSFKKVLVELDMREEELKKSIDQFDERVDQLDKIEQDALQLKKDAKELLEEKALYETILKKNPDVSIEKKIEKVNKLLTGIEELLQEIENEKIGLKVIIKEREELIKEYEESINYQKSIIKKAIEIQTLGLQHYFYAFLYIVTGVLTIVQRDNFFYIQEYINEIDPLLKGYLFLSAISLVGGTIIYKRSVNDAEKHLEKNSKISFWKVIKFPNIFELSIIVLVSVYLFFSNLIGSLLNNDIGMLVVIFINSIFITLVSHQINDLARLIFSEFNRAIRDPKDRLAAIVAVVGTIISLVALLK